MRHHNHNRKFGRPARQRSALLRSLARSLIRHETIRTTEAKAKEARPFVEKLITRGRRNSLAARRLITARLGGDAVLARKVVDVLAPRFANRPGGYTRIVKLVHRPSDGSPMAVLELVGRE